MPKYIAYNRFSCDCSPICDIPEDAINDYLDSYGEFNDGDLSLYEITAKIEFSLEKVFVANKTVIL